MEKIPTAEEYINGLSKGHVHYDGHDTYHFGYYELRDFINKYAEIHREAALNAAANPKSIPAFNKPGKTWVSKEDILNAYPPENIK